MLISNKLGKDGMFKYLYFYLLVMYLFVIPNILVEFFLETFLKKTWKNLRDGLSKCVKKRELLTRSGTGTSKLPICKLYKQLLFLKDSVSNRKSDSNLKFTDLQDTSQAYSPVDTPFQSPPHSLLCMATPLNKERVIPKGQRGQNQTTITPMRLL